MELSKRSFTLLILGTLALLLYVHEQTLIFQTSYSIEKKERKVAYLSEDYKTAKFRVARMRSPHILNQRMKELSLDLTIPKEQEIIKIVKSRIVPQQLEIAWPNPLQFLSVFHFVKEAQARTSKE